MATIDEMYEEVKGLTGVNGANRYSPACICDGCQFSARCYGWRMGNFCHIDYVQDLKQKQDSVKGG